MAKSHKQNRSKKSSHRVIRRKRVQRGGKPIFSSYKLKVENFLDGKTNQIGGGYSTDVGEGIAGNPVHVSYSNCTTPVVIDHKLVTSNDCSPVCASGGGSARGLLRRLARQNRRSSKKSRKNRKSKRSSKKSKKNRKLKVRKTRKVNRLSGGGLIPGSMPSSFPIEGKAGVFTGDMSQREFGCRQPNWGPKCV